MKQLLLTLLFALAAFMLKSQDTLRVPADYAHIQEALDLAQDGTTILVDQGVYEESLVWPNSIDGIRLIGNSSDSTIVIANSGDRVLTIDGGQTSDSSNVITPRTLIRGLHFFGGLIENGNGAGLFVNNASPTIESIISSDNDIKNGYGAGAYFNNYFGVINDSSFEYNSGQASYGVGMSVENSDFVLTNCNFTYNDGYKGEGVGLRVVGSKGEIENCDFIGNSGEFSLTGVAAYLSNYDGTFNSCLIELNTLDGYGDGGRNSGVYMAYTTANAKLEITDCTFRNNLSSNSFIGSSALVIEGDDHKDSAEISLSECTFENNSVTGFGLGGFVDYKGAVLLSASDVYVQNCSFLGNHIDYDASRAVDPEQVSTISAGLNVYASELQITDCHFENNKGFRGTALYAESKTGILRRSKFINNGLDTIIESLDSGVVFFEGSDEGSSLVMENCILANNPNNLISMNSPAEDSLSLIHCTIALNTSPIMLSSDYVSATNSIFWNNGGAHFADDSLGLSAIVLDHCLIDGGWPGTNIIDADPLFVSNDILSLTEGSPCLEAGVMTGLTNDIDGNDRPVPVGTAPDLGAYELGLLMNVEEVASRELSLFPNPAQDFVYLNLLAETIRIYDVQGRLVQRLAKSNKIDVSGLELGSYVLECTIGNQVFLEKLVVTR